jgi:sterol desaturase/sphingolipid hydroxylase (fatty acid hydroxylase superfamily)
VGAATVNPDHPSLPVQAIKRLFNPALLAGIAGYSLVIWLGYFMLNRLAPDALTLDLLGRHLSVDHLHDRLMDKALYIIVIPPLFFLLEFLVVGWEDCSAAHLLKRPTRSGWSDVVMYFVGFLPGMRFVISVLTFGTAFITATWIRTQIQAMTGLSLTIVGAPLLVQMGILFLLYTFGDYWAHRIDHLKALWPLHRYHHAAEEFYSITASRVHPISFTALISLTLPAALVEASFDALAYTAFFIACLRVVIHSRIESDFGWLGRWVIQAPLHHRLHHRLDLVGPAKHLGLMPIWDRMFGTWDGQVNGKIVIGVDTPYRHGAWILPDLARDYRDFLLDTTDVVLKTVGLRRREAAVAAAPAQMEIRSVERAPRQLDAA